MIVGDVQCEGAALRGLSVTALAVANLKILTKWGVCESSKNAADLNSKS